LREEVAQFPRKISSSHKNPNSPHFYLFSESNTKNHQVPSRTPTNTFFLPKSISTNHTTTNSKSTTHIKIYSTETLSNPITKRFEPHPQFINKP